MKKTSLFGILMCLFSWVYAQTPPQEVNFEGKLISIGEFMLPQVLNSDGTVSVFVQYEMTFAHETNITNTLKVRVTYPFRTRLDIANNYPNGGAEAWNMKVGKIYHFKLTKHCTDAQTLGDESFYKYICVPQTTDCSKVVFKTNNITMLVVDIWSDLVIYEGHLYKFKMIYTNKYSYTDMQHGFRD